MPVARYPINPTPSAAGVRCGVINREPSRARGTPQTWCGDCVPSARREHLSDTPTLRWRLVWGYWNSVPLAHIAAILMRLPWWWYKIFLPCRKKCVSLQSQTESVVCGKKAHFRLIPTMWELGRSTDNIGNKSKMNALVVCIHMSIWYIQWSEHLAFILYYWEAKPTHGK